MQFREVDAFDNGLARNRVEREVKRRWSTDDGKSLPPSQKKRGNRGDSSGRVGRGLSEGSREAIAGSCEAQQLGRWNAIGHAALERKEVGAPYSIVTGTHPRSRFFGDKTKNKGRKE